MGAQGSLSFPQNGHQRVSTSAYQEPCLCPALGPWSCLVSVLTLGGLNREQTCPGGPASSIQDPHPNLSLDLYMHHLTLSVHLPLRRKGSTEHQSPCVYITAALTCV